MDPTRNRLRRVVAVPCFGGTCKAEAAMPALLALVVCLWYWPVFAGRQPAEGDVTAFFYPLMTSYARSLGEGDWPPLWNDRWGYGFPALAESQTGVFYPTHLLLFGLFAPATAYSLNLLVNMLLAAMFAYLAARTIGLGPMGAALGGLVFFAGDFFTVHAPHQWAYTTGCWYPLAVLLAWRTLALPRLHGADPGHDGTERPDSGHPCRRSTLLNATLLAAVLAVQIYGGHFQLAFYTQVTVLLMALGSFFVTTGKRKTRFGRAGLIVAAWIGSLLLAAVQLLPTAELARQSTLRGGDYEYLSGFANTPWHLVNYLAGALFHTSPLWRGVVWSPSMPGAADPWRTAPEECLNYVGLVPLCLVLSGWRRWWSYAATRLCAAMIIVTLLFSFGPYLPGFHWLIHLPGFGWFRSAARWNLATTFWMAMLAGVALERLSAVQLRRTIRTFAVLWIGLIAILTAVLWTCSRADARHSPVHRYMHMPPDMADPYVVARFVEQGYPLNELLGARHELTLADRWPSLLLREVGPYAVVLSLMVALCLPKRLPRAGFAAALLMLTLGDLALLISVRPLSWQPVDYLKSSTVLQALAKRAEPNSVHRTIDPFRNLSLVAGAAPVLTYRTLDVPVFATVPLVALAEVGRRPVGPELARIFELSGIETVIEAAGGDAQPESNTSQRSFPDPVLVAALYGKRYAEQIANARPELLTYRLLSPDRTLAHAWTVAQPAARTAPRVLRALPDPASVGPARVERFGPHHVVLEANVDGPAVLVLTDLYYPGWQATLETKGPGTKKPATLLKAFDAWRAIPLPGRGRYRVELRYRPASYAWGKWLSASAWAAWLLIVAVVSATRQTRERSAGAEMPRG